MKRALLAASLAAICSNAQAIEPFTPLTASATLANTNENANPFLLPGGWIQTEVTDVGAMNGLFGGAYPTTFRAWDMIDIGGSDGRFVYIPHEVQTGAGITRYDRDAGTAAILLRGNNSGTFDANPADGWDHEADDFGAFDPNVLTPWNTLLTAEEWSGNGRIFELLNPETATSPADADWRWLASIPSVSHEGLKFDAAGNLYFVDEWNSGSIYKFVPATPGDLTVGQTFVLVDDDGAHNAAANYNVAPNTVAANRTGPATWVPMTDATGAPLTTQDPFVFTFNQGTRGGLLAADELGGTPYGRPEDLMIGELANGNEVVYVATTSEQAVYSIELNPNGDADSTDAVVRVFAQGGATPNGNGTPVPAGAQSTYGLGSPDNLAIDKDGQVLINEDQNPGDIWVATDANGDGIAEKIDLFTSLGPFGSEPTGVISDPRGGFLVAVQHPSSDNDALWSLRPDSDLDGIANNEDNCSRVANADQRDTNADDFGNACDADLNDDGIVNGIDSGLFRAAFGSADPHADFNGDGVVNALDSGIFRRGYGAPPGPAYTTE